MKKPQRSMKSGEPTYTVSMDKHQGPKKGPSARRKQRKASSGERKKRPTTRTANFFFTLFFLKHQEAKRSVPVGSDLD
jgi:hypothetical protein